MDMLTTGLTKIQSIRHTATPAQFVRQRIASAATELSLAGDAQLSAELLNEIMLKTVTVLYEKDADNVWSNLDCVTYRVLIPMPWAGKGHKLWGVNYLESIILRAILRERAVQKLARPPLFDFSETSLSWYMDVGNYGTLPVAMRYLEKEPITLATWRRHHTQRKAYVMENVLRYRSNQANGK